MPMHFRCADAVMDTLSPSNRACQEGKLLKATCPRIRRLGFSLVEVTLSIGVVAFAFLSLMALLPGGMEIFREAMDTTVTAQIAQRITTELQETDFHTLLEEAELDPESADPVTRLESIYGTLPHRFFDDQGNEVRSTGEDGELTEENRRRVLYEVHVRIARNRQIPSYSPNDGSQDRLGSRNLATALIQVISNPAGQNLEIDPGTQLVDDTTTRLPIQSYPAVIARNGSEARIPAVP